MARLSRNTLRTVRFYEEEGLLSPVQRTSGGHRLFESSELDKLRLVSDLRVCGLSLDEIKALLEVKLASASGSQAAQDVVARLEQQIAIMTDRIALMQQLREELARSRSWLGECRDCTHPDLFPTTCEQCEHVQEREEIPSAAQILWGIKK